MKVLALSSHHDGQQLAYNIWTKKRENRTELPNGIVCFCEVLLALPGRGALDGQLEQWADHLQRLRSVEVVLVSNGMNSQPISRHRLQWYQVAMKAQRIKQECDELIDTIC
jgi:hypothetical protein